MATDFDIRVPIHKSTPEGLVYGWGYQSVGFDGAVRTDVSGQRISSTELSKALRRSFSDIVAGGTDEHRRPAPGVIEHTKIPAQVVTLALIDDTFKAAFGTDEHGAHHLADFKPEGIAIGYQLDPASPTFAKVASGKLPMFSIVGRAKRSKVAKAAGEPESEHTEDLIDLSLSRIGLVAEGDNPGAMVTLWKATPGAVRRFVQRLTATDTPEVFDVSKLAPIGAWAKGIADEKRLADDLSYQSGVDAAALRAVFGGARAPTEEEITGIAVALGVTVDDVRAQAGAPPVAKEAPVAEKKDPRAELVAKAAALFEAKKITAQQLTDICVAKAVTPEMVTLLSKLLQDGALDAEQHAALLMAIGGGSAPVEAPEPADEPKPEDMGKARPEAFVKAVDDAVKARLDAHLADHDAERCEVNKAAELRFIPESPEKIGKALHSLRKTDATAADFFAGLLRASDAIVAKAAPYLTEPIGTRGQERGEETADQEHTRLCKAKMEENKGMDWTAAARLVEADHPILKARLARGE